MRTLILTLFAAIPGLLHAEAPYVGSIVNLATREARFSPGVLADLRYGFLDPSDTSSNRVLVGGREVEWVDNEDGSVITIQFRCRWIFRLGPTGTEPLSLTLGCNSTAMPGERPPATS